MTWPEFWSETIAVYGGWFLIAVVLVADIVFRRDR